MKRALSTVAGLLERGARAAEQIAKEAAAARAALHTVGRDDVTAHFVAQLLVRAADLHRERDRLRRELAEERDEHETHIDRAAVALARADQQIETLKETLEREHSAMGETGRLRARGERIAELEQRLDERLRDLVTAQQRVSVLETEVTRLHDVRVRLERERDAAKLAHADALAREQRRLSDADELPPSAEKPS